MNQKVIKRALNIKRPEGCTHLAVIFKGSLIQAYAWNDVNKTSKFCFEHGYPYAKRHAEVGAILKYLKTHSSRELARSSMLVLRFIANGDMRTSKPCKNCSNFLKVFPVKRVYWFDDGAFKEGV